MQSRLRLHNLPLFWKILLPFTTVVAVVGAAGVFVIVNDLSSRAQAALEAELGRRGLDARATITARELFVLESTNLAANLEGMPAATARDDVSAVRRLLRSVLALKPELSFVAVTDARGERLADLASRSKRSPQLPNDLSSVDVVSKVVSGRSGKRAAGFVKFGGRQFLAVAAPICRPIGTCRPVGVAITGLGPRSLISPSLRSAEADAGIGLYDQSGSLITRDAGSAPREIPRNAADTQTSGFGATERTTHFTPITIQGRRVGTLAISIPTAPALSVVRSAAGRLVLVVLGTMAGIFLLGGLISRTIVRRVKQLLATNAAIAAGDLSTRAPVTSLDELGALARGVNEMAQQLQASHETLELRVAQRTEEVQRLLKDRTEFFASLSHELRTPLAIILGEVVLLEREGNRSAGPLGSSAEQLLDVVNDILDLARADSEGLDLKVEEVDVADFLSGLEPTLQGLAKGNGVEMNLDLQKDAPPIAADRGRLREIILNLVDNAVKYTPTGGRVSLSAGGSNGAMHFAVSDTGVGIPEEARPFLFEPFFRVPGTAPQQGQASTGLGLALTKRLVEAHGGVIDYESAHGAGSTFRFTIPTAPSKA